VGLGSCSGDRKAYGSEGTVCCSVGLSGPRNRLPLSELGDLDRRMRSHFFRALTTKTGKSLCPEWLSQKEQDPAAGLEETMWSTKREAPEKQSCIRTLPMPPLS